MTHASRLPAVRKHNGRTSYHCPHCAEFQVILEDSSDADIIAWRAFTKHRNLCSAKASKAGKKTLRESVLA